MSSPAAQLSEKLARIATAVLLVASAAMFVRGFVYSDMLGKVPWAPDGALRAVLLSVGYWLVAVAIAAPGPRGLALRAAIAVLLVLAACAGVSAVLAAAWVFASGCAIGHAILSRAGRAAVTVADLPLCIALGLGLLGAVLAPLGLLHVRPQFTYFAILTLPIVWRGRALATLLRDAHDRAVPLARRDAVLLGAIGNVVVVIVAMALLPDVGNDALAFHLLIAEHVRDFGSWHYDVQRNVLAVAPIAVDFLYAAAVVFGDEAAARLVNAGMLVTLLWLVYASVRSAGDPTAALLATLVAAASPLAMAESASLFIDNGWALFVVTGIVFMLQYARARDPTRLVAAGVVFGCALSAKLLTAAAAPAVAVLLAAAWSAHGRRFDKLALVLAVLLGVAVAAPPYVIATVLTGNPVFPFANAVFGSPFYPAVNFTTRYANSPSLLLAYQMTFYSDQYIEALPGAFGFSVLLLAPALAVAAPVWGRREGAMTLFAALSFALMVVAGVALYLRYLYPALFMLAMAFGFALATLRARCRPLATALSAVAVLASVTSVAFLTAGYAPTRAFAIAAIVDREAREAHVEAWAHQRRVVEVLNALPGDEAVAFLGGTPFFAGLRRPAYADSSYVRPFYGRTKAIASRDEMLGLIRDFDLGYVVLDAKVERDFSAFVRSLATPVATLGRSTIYRVDAGGARPRTGG